MSNTDGDHAEWEGIYVVGRSVERIHNPHPFLINHILHRLVITELTCEYLSILSPFDILLSEKNMSGILFLHISISINYANDVLLQNHCLVRRIHLGNEILEVDLRFLYSHVYNLY